MNLRHRLQPFYRSDSECYNTFEERIEFNVLAINISKLNQDVCEFFDIYWDIVWIR